MRLNFTTAIMSAVLAFGLVAAGQAWADSASSDWATTEQTKVRLVSAATASGGATVPLGLQFVLAPNWKTYWRSPGDAGFPVSVDWSGSTNLAAAELSWPVPHRFTLFDLDTFGYEDEVVFPIAAKPANPARPL